MQKDDPVVRKFEREIGAGTVALVALSLLDRSRESLYGYQIAKGLSALAPPDLPIKQGTLYPVLRSMERQGLLGSSIRPSESGPPRRYYAITRRGESALAHWKTAWHRLCGWVKSQTEEKDDA